MTATDDYAFSVLDGEAGGPLLFTFHGTGGDETQFLAVARQLMPGATVVAPRGDVSEHGALRFFRRTGEGVYDMDDLARATAKMAGFVRRQVAARSPSAVAGLGYSNGANILATVLFAEPDLFDAVVLMHPLIPFVPSLAASLDRRRVLITAGRRDPICPPDMTVALEGFLRGAGASVDLLWHDGGHDLRNEELSAARDVLTGTGGSGKEDGHG